MAEKGFLDHPDLIDRLEQLGMQINDKTKAEAELRRLGYHRTSGYRYPFRKLREPLTDELIRRREFRHDEFEAGSRFEDSIALADFDTKLRAVILTGIFDLEVRLRTAIAHVIAQKNPKGHLEISCLDSIKCCELTSSRDKTTKFEAWKAQYESAKKSKNNDDFIAHHTLVYRGLFKSRHAPHTHQLDNGPTRGKNMSVKSLQITSSHTGQDRCYTSVQPASQPRNSPHSSQPSPITSPGQNQAEDHQR